MKKTILTCALMITLLGALSLESCNSEKKAATTDSPAVDSNAADSNAVVNTKDSVTVDSGHKGTKVPSPN